MTKSVVHVGVHEAKTHLSHLLGRVEAGDEVIIDRRGRPVARLTAIDTERIPRFGTDRGAVVVSDGFDAPLPADFADAVGAVDG